MSAAHTAYLKVLRERRDSLPHPSGSWASADFELRAVADAFHSTGDIGYHEMLEHMDSTRKIAA